VIKGAPVSEEQTQQSQVVNEDMGRVNRDEVDAEVIEALASWGREYPFAGDRA
jgi:hypothetical protein